MANVSTFGTLKSELLSLLGRAPSDMVYQLVTADINAELKLQVMEGTAALIEGAEVKLGVDISGATQANPCVITATGHSFATGTLIQINDVVGMTELNGNTYTATRIDANSFSIGVDSGAYTAYTSGGKAELSPGFISVISLYRDTDPRYALQPVPAQTIHRQYVTSGIPQEYAIVDDAMLLNPSPSGSEDLELRYIGRVAEFSGDDDTNDILTRYPGIYIYGACFHHSRLIKDYNAAQSFLSDYNREKRRAATTDTANRTSGSPIKVKPRVVA